MSRRAGITLLAAALALVAVRATDFGDRGLRNVFSALAALVLVAVALVVFARAEGVSRRLRRSVLAGLAVLGVAAGVLVRVDGFDGELVPSFRWRLADHARPAVPAPASSARPLGGPSPADFPGFLGPRRDNTVPGVRLARDWDAHPPRVLWRGPIGSGWGAFAVAGGRAFVLEQVGDEQRASARAADDGTLLWSTRLDRSFAHPLGGEGPGATPTVVLDGDGGGRVFALTSHGILAALDARDGALLWSHDLVLEGGWDAAREAEFGPYGRSHSPLRVEDLVIVPQGGDPEHGGAGLVAFDAASGVRRWAGPPRDFSCSSPALATLGGEPQVLVLNEATASGHALADGRLLWEHPFPGRTSADPNVSQPVALPDGRVLLSKGYGQGGQLLALLPRADGTFETRVEWSSRRLLRTKMTNVVVHEDCIYALDDGMLECVAVADGALRWKEGRYGHGQMLLVGELLLLVSEEGELFLIDPSPERPDAVLGRAQVLEGKCWAHLAFADGVLYVRNAEECAAWVLATEPG